MGEMSEADVQIREEPIDALIDHAQIPIAFRVERILELQVSGDDLAGIALEEHSVEMPYTKDYDTRGGPTRWTERFDTRNWGLITAFRGPQRVGGAAVAFQTPNLWLLDGREDLAALWDIRVQPELRGLGIGSDLFQAVEDWARRHGCLQLKVETQNTNVPACHFYVQMGCTLGGINRFAYGRMATEAQLLWFKDL